MADADCKICELMGYRTCDWCSGIVYQTDDGVDMCDGCRQKYSDEIYGESP